LAASCSKWLFCSGDMPEWGCQKQNARSGKASDRAFAGLVCGN
jgi:hypothetical protein